MVSYLNNWLCYLSLFILQLHSLILQLRESQCSILVILTFSLLILVLFLSISLCTGSPKALSFSLINTSFVPMTFCPRVLGDGLGSPNSRLTCPGTIGESVLLQTFINGRLSSLSTLLQALCLPHLVSPLRYSTNRGAPI